MTARTDEQEDAARMRAGFGEALALTEEAMTLDRNTLLESAKKYRKKPIVIEALCWTGTNLREVIDFTGLHPSANKWTWEEYEAVVAKDGFKIFTLEGAHLVSVGDYVIRGVKGEFYACKPDIFAMTYENALAAQQPESNRDAVLETNAFALSGAYWRLEKYGFVCSHNADDPKHEAEADHWRDIANQASEIIRAFKNADGQVTSTRLGDKPRSRTSEWIGGRACSARTRCRRVVAGCRKHDWGYIGYSFGPRKRTCGSGNSHANTSGSRGWFRSLACADLGSFSEEQRGFVGGIRRTGQDRRWSEQCASKLSWRRRTLQEHLPAYR